MQVGKKSIISRFIGIVWIICSVSTFSLNAAWSPPMQISPGASAVNASGTPLVIDSNSVALVGWLDGQIGVAQSLFSSNLFPQSDTWTSPDLIYTNSTPGFPAFPVMAVDPVGNSLAIFGLINLSSNTVSLNASRRPLGSLIWGAPIVQILNGFPAGGSIGNGDMGHFAALLPVTPTNSPPYDITYIQLPENSPAWLAPIVIAQDSSVLPAVATKGFDGKSILVWKVNTPSLQLQSENLDFQTQQFSAMMNVPLPPSTLDVVLVNLAVDSKGNAVLIYIAQLPTGANLYSSTLLNNSGSTWSSPLLISNPANMVVNDAEIAIDAQGTATIVWIEQSAVNEQFVRAATLPLGGTPQFVTNLTNDVPNTSVSSVRVAMDSFGNAVAVWAINVSGNSLVQVSSKPAGQNWSSPDTLSTTGFMPLVALSDQGTAVVTWNDSITTILYGSRNLFLFPLNSPSNFVGTVIKNQFLTETSYFLQMNWDPSLSTNILFYNIFKNGKLVSTIPAGVPFTLLLPIRSKHVKSGTYTIVATASNGNRSLAVPIVIKGR